MTFSREPDAEPIPGYRLIELLGTGGFGEVWKCEAPGGLYKAIKFIYGNLNAVDGESARAEQEYNALNRVKEVRHPFVLSMDRIEVVEGEVAIVMELADKSLHDLYVECQGAGLVGIPRDDLLRYLRDASEALDHMIQKHHLLHLDIKPRNLFLISDRVKVADFGLVKQLEGQSGMLNSITPLYAPPETFNGEISEHSDQYSLALVYCELLTGQRPFNGKTARQLVIQHTQEEPELRALLESERPIVARALSKDPAKRHPDCMSFVRALYNARPAVKPEPIAADAATPVLPGRPKSMAETLESEFLEPREAHDEHAAHGSESNGAAPDEVSRLGITMSLPQSGSLRPTVILGLGAFGRRAIQEVRCRIMDRLGDLAKLPMLRLLYVDPDADALRAAVRNHREMTGSSDEVCHLPLQPVSNYRRRLLEQVTEWLPREKLYSLPRSLQTQGSRALGRLAFADNHLRFLARLRRELQAAIHPDALYASVSQTGLALRDSRPRVIVVGAAGGGSSGLLVDLGYGLRRLFQQMKQPQAEVLAFLLCGAPEDPATPRQEQANVYATLTELNHFMDPGVRFTAQYGADGPRTVDQGKPYHQVYLLKLGHRGQEALSDTVAHLGSYLFHELTTPLGLRLDRHRSPHPPAGATPFRSFGTFAVWFPRGLLLRQAGRQACVQLIAEWQKNGTPSAEAEIDAACARAMADPELRFESVCVRIQEQVAAQFDGNLPAALTTMLSTIEEQSQQTVAQDDPGNWAPQALTRVQELVGGSHRSESDSGWRRARLGRALVTAIQKLATDWDVRLAQDIFRLMDHPGLRVAAAEAALERLIHFCQETAAAQQQYLEQQYRRTEQAWQQLQQALESCQTSGGGFRLFGSPSRRLLRVFMDHLAAYSRQRLVEEVFSAGLEFWSTLEGRLPPRPMHWRRPRSTQRPKRPNRTGRSFGIPRPPSWCCPTARWSWKAPPEGSSQPSLPSNGRCSIRPFRTACLRRAGGLNRRVCRAAT
jgi:serine/threonine protein kinase